jgi:Arc/MetJ-type ribon-helix-helix transcriptional regulator
MTLDDDVRRHNKVYTPSIGRTQIYLTSEELDLLDRAQQETGASRSELIRRAVRTLYGRRRRELPRSIGIASDGRLSAADLEDWLEREWDRDLGGRR